MGNFPELGQVSDTNTKLSTKKASIALQIVICMLKENSKQLLDAQYIQSNIGFKRVVGWKEFELGGLHLGTRISEFNGLSINVYNY